MKIEKRFSFSIIFFLLLCVELFSAPIDVNTKKAVETKAKDILTCSADGRNGTLLPAHALAKLKKGMEIVFLPDNYGEIVLEENTIIISSEGDGPVCGHLAIKGKNCIVRNFCGQSLSIEKDAVIVNSILRHIQTSNLEPRKKMSLIVYNSAINDICLAYENIEINMRNCIIKLPYNVPPQELRGAPCQTGLLRCTPGSDLLIENSILFSDNYVFTFEKSWNNEKGKLTLKDNILFGKNGLGVLTNNHDPKKKGGTVALSVKDLKRLWSVAIQGENNVTQIEFLKNKMDNNCAANRNDISTIVTSFMPKDFDTKEIGIIVEENPFFKKVLEAKKMENEQTQAVEEIVEPPKPVEKEECIEKLPKKIEEKEVPEKKDAPEEEEEEEAEPEDVFDVKS
jgi:hypothetical protein